MPMRLPFPIILKGILPLLALSCACGPQPAAGRLLAQSSDAAATDQVAAEAEPALVNSPSAEGNLASPYGSPVVDKCVQLTNTASMACTTESDTLSLVYPRGSDKPPTQSEFDTAIANMKAAAQPSAFCCQELRPFSDGRCPCDPGFLQLLPIGGFDPAYFQGATAILAQACGYGFAPCQPGETAQVNVTDSAG